MLTVATVIGLPFLIGCAAGEGPFSKTDFLLGAQQGDSDGKTSGGGLIEKLCTSAGYEADCDPCAIMGWYADAECDAFCPEPDPSCPAETTECSCGDGASGGSGSGTGSGEGDGGGGSGTGSGGSAGGSGAGDGGTCSCGDDASGGSGSGAGSGGSGSGGP